MNPCWSLFFYSRVISLEILKNKLLQDFQYAKKASMVEFVY